jgi:hypothetical protein
VGIEAFPGKQVLQRTPFLDMGGQSTGLLLTAHSGQHWACVLRGRRVDRHRAEQQILEIETEIRQR